MKTVSGIGGHFQACGVVATFAAVVSLVACEPSTQPATPPRPTGPSCTTNADCPPPSECQKSAPDAPGVCSHTDVEPDAADAGVLSPGPGPIVQPSSDDIHI